MASSGVSKATLEKVWAREASACLICHAPLVRGGGGYSVHHRRPRGMGGSRDPVAASPANLVLLCGTGTTGCHGRVERSRDWYRDVGLLVPQGTDPATVPIRLPGRGELWLEFDGGTRRTDVNPLTNTGAGTSIDL